tara:strand:- start:344 stop:1207 length:864 start_codon:yes stop_codon:yes gene_type:complete
MAIYKGINPSSVNVYEVETHRLFELSSSDVGVNSIQYRSGSKQVDNITFTEAGNYWNSLLLNFYLSGSNGDVAGRFFGHDFGSQDTLNQQHKNKFYSSGSVVYIPQYYFGEGIQKNSLTLTSGGVTLKDDGNGNLYSTTLNHTSSADTSISASLNYKGNIFYKKGVVTITDTGSYDGVNYLNITTGSFNVSFKSTHTIFTSEHEIIIKPGEFNSTSNPTIRKELSGLQTHESPLYASHLTSSGWNPIMTTIGFYEDDETQPVMIARYSQPVKIRDDMTLIFKVRMDY